MSAARSGKGRGYHEVRDEIASGHLRPVYLLHGVETRLQEDLLRALRQACLEPGFEDFNYQVVDGETAVPHEVANHLSTAPVLGGRRMVVVRELPCLEASRGGADAPGEPQAPPDEAGWVALVRAVPKTASPAWVLIFTLRHPADGRRRLYREIASRGGVVDCFPLPRGDIVRWLGRKARDAGKQLAPDAAEALVAMVGTDLSRLWQELQKAMDFAGEAGQVTVEHVRSVATRATSWQVFDLTDAVAERRGELALNILRDLMQAGEPPGRLLSLLARQVRLLLAAGDRAGRGLPPDRIAADLGLPPWVARQYLRQAARFRRRELVEAFEAMVEADLATKSGQREPGLALELVVARLTGATRP